MSKEALLKRADELMDKLLEHNLQFSAQTGAAQIVDDLIVALRSTTAQDAVDAERYRLLRRGQHWSVIDGIGNVLRGNELDAAIAAQKGQP